MADVLEDPLPAERLFDYRPTDGGPPRWLPIGQGDIFRDISLPGIPVSGDNSDRLCMIFMHPCTMRAGVKLRPIVTMIEVRRFHDQSVIERPEKWSNWYRGMPLPNLFGDSIAFSGDFMSLASVPSEELHRDRRIASFSAHGRLQFQQRVINHLTRFAPSTALLAQSSTSLEAELELQADWMERTCELRGDSDESIGDAEVEFDKFLSAPQEAPDFTMGENTPLQTTRRELLALGEFSGVNADMQKHLESMN